MRYTVILLGLLISLVSCKSALIINDIEAENIQNEAAFYSPDSSIILLVAPYKEKLEEDMSKTISYSSEELTKAKPESKLTNLVADLLMEAGKYFSEAKRKDAYPDMAFVNYGGLRTSLPKGEITVGNIFELMPFENELVLMKLSGKTMEMFIDKIAERGGDGVSGIKLGFKDGQVAHLTIGGKQLDSNKDYWLATNDYIANGGDDMSMLADRKELIKTGHKIRDLIIYRLKDQYQSGKGIDLQLDGRIFKIDD
jgi:2',3'-cyclic-nucleotide 2'-phosphodiesterase (5'-nucleotidase family)